MSRMVDQGLLSRAASQLGSRGLAPCTAETKATLEKLFPSGQLPLRPGNAPAPSIDVQAAAVKKIILHAPKGLAPGHSGLRAEHLKALLADRNLGRAAAILSTLTQFANSIMGYFPSELQPFLCGGRLIPLRKKDGGIRPLVVIELLRSLVSKLCLQEVSSSLRTLQPLQIGVGGSGPVIQAAILTVKSWLASMSPDEVLLKIDIANAYNTIDREACLAGVAKFCPDALRWARWCLDGASRVYDSEVIPCTKGVQQGDPLAPMLFSVGLHLWVLSGYWSTLNYGLSFFLMTRS